MNVILDIDETFVQYVGKDDWASLSDEQRAKFETGGANQNGLFILRPHFDEFFEYLFNEADTVSLWTWSDIEYAQGVADMIRKRNPKWKIANTWADEDVDASIALNGHNKDLNYIWYTKNMFQPCDTILVDDLDSNTQNPSNIKNGIKLKAFDVLGEKKRVSKTKIRTGHFTDMSNDDTLLKVIEVLKKVKSNPDFCSEGDMPFPFEGSTKVGGRRKTIRKRKHRRTVRKYRK